MTPFRVIDKDTHESFDVYDITYDAVTGYPQFLIYKDAQWLRVSAKHYKPAELVDTLNIEDLKEKYESDSRPLRRNKAFEQLQNYEKDFVYDLHMGNLKED